MCVWDGITFSHSASGLSICLIITGPSLRARHWDFSKCFIASSSVLTQVSVSFYKTQCFDKKQKSGGERSGKEQGSVSSRPLILQQQFPQSHALPLSEWTNPVVYVRWELCVSKTGWERSSETREVTECFQTANSCQVKLKLGSQLIFSNPMYSFFFFLNPIVCCSLNYEEKPHSCGFIAYDWKKMTVTHTYFLETHSSFRIKVHWEPNDENRVPGEQQWALITRKKLTQLCVWQVEVVSAVRLHVDDKIFCGVGYQGCSISMCMNIYSIQTLCVSDISDDILKHRSKGIPCLSTIMVK